MLAVIKAGGKQYTVKAGDKLKIEKLEQAVASELSFIPLLVAEEDASMVEVGNPEVKGKTVTAKILAQGRHDKVHIIKFKNKVRYRRKNGHRQPFTEIEITAIK